MLAEILTLNSFKEHDDVEMKFPDVSLHPPMFSGWVKEVRNGTVLVVPHIEVTDGNGLHPYVHERIEIPVGRLRHMIPGSKGGVPTVDELYQRLIDRI